MINSSLAPKIRQRSHPYERLKEAFEALCIDLKDLEDVEEEFKLNKHETEFLSSRKATYHYLSSKEAMSMYSDYQKQKSKLTAELNEKNKAKSMKT